MVKVADGRTPVIVGVGQVENRVDRGDEEVEPVELIARAAEAAAPRQQRVVTCARPSTRYGS